MVVMRFLFFFFCEQNKKNSQQLTKCTLVNMDGSLAAQIDDLISFLDCAVEEQPLEVQQKKQIVSPKPKKKKKNNKTKRNHTANHKNKDKKPGTKSSNNKSRNGDLIQNGDILSLKIDDLPIPDLNINDIIKDSKNDKFEYDNLSNLSNFEYYKELSLSNDFWCIVGFFNNDVFHFPCILKIRKKRLNPNIFRFKFFFIFY